MYGQSPDPLYLFFACINKNNNIFFLAKVIGVTKSNAHMIFSILNMKVSMNNKEMPCNWLLVGETCFCKNSTREQYCASHAFKIRKGVIIPQPCKGCGRGTKSSVRLCVPCGQGKERAYIYYKRKYAEGNRLRSS